MKVRLLLRFFAYLRPYWFKEALLLVLMAGVSLCSLASPFFLKIVIDEAFPNRDYGLLMRILAALVSINLVRVAFSALSDYLYEWLGNRVIAALREDLFNHLLRLPVPFFDQNKTGDILSRISSDVNAVQNVITGSLTRFAHSFFLVAGLGVALCLLNFRLFVISILVLPLVLVVNRYFQPRVRRLLKEGREQDAGLMGYFLEQFENVKLVKSHDTYAHESTRLRAKIERLIGVNLRRVRLSAFARSLSTLLMSITPILIFGLGGQQVMQQAITLGTLVAFLQYFSRLQGPLKDLMGLYVDLVRASVSVQRIFDFFDLPTEPAGGKPVRIEPGQRIAFSNVQYAHEDTPVLHNLNLQLRTGRKYALVGPSGCGKSTILNLLCRFYAPAGGSITLDGVPLEEMALGALRQRIALVTQEPLLLGDSVHNNIGYGQLGAPPGAVEAAARLVGAHELIARQARSANGTIGDRGVKLSGGQKQRIALARALLKNADILLLDEATSALDPESEKEVLASLFRAYAGKTIILVSHRLSSIQEVDEIICLDGGQVVEQGTHGQLLAKASGYYRTFFHNQTAPQHAGNATLLQ
jgi:ABC-type multidrug transport system fused ATPase/permease subunit